MPTPSAALVLLLLLSTVAPAQAAPLPVLRSPDRRIEVRIDLGDRIRYDVMLDNQALVQDATLSIQVDQSTLGVQPKLTAAKATSVDQEIEPAVRQKSAKLRERYNQLRLDLRGGYAVVFRAYDEGVAYRLETSLIDRTFVPQARSPVPATYSPKPTNRPSHGRRDTDRRTTRVRWRPFVTTPAS